MKCWVNWRGSLSERVCKTFSEEEAEMWWRNFPCTDGPWAQFWIIYDMNCKNGYQSCRSNGKVQVPQKILSVVSTTARSWWTHFLHDRQFHYKTEKKLSWKVCFFFRDKGDFSRFSIHLERCLISNTLNKKCKFGQISPNGQKLWEKPEY